MRLVEQTARKQASSYLGAESERTRQYKNKSPAASSTETTGRQNATKRAKALQPEYVQCCSCNTTTPKVYAFWLWQKGAPETRSRMPYRCGSWRCEGCEKHAAAVVFARVKEAFSPYRPSDCVFAVLTLDPTEHKRADWELADVYRALRRKVESWRKRVARWALQQGLDFAGSRLVPRTRRDKHGRVRTTEDLKLGSEWVSIIEAHRSGVPHVNLVFHSPKLAEYLRNCYDAFRASGASHREATLLHGEVLDHAEACSIGWSSTLEAVDSKDRGRADLDQIAGYIAKAAKRSDKIHGEIAKLSQLPLQAPKNFRRVRAGKGFLPPKRKDERYTGAIVRSRWTREGDQEAESLVKRYKCPVLAAQVEEVVQKEQAIWFEHEEFRSAALTASAEQRLLLNLAATTAPRVTVHHFKRDYATTTERPGESQQREKEAAGGMAAPVDPTGGKDFGASEADRNAEFIDHRGRSSLAEEPLFQTKNWTIAHEKNEPTTSDGARALGGERPPPSHHQTTERLTEGAPQETQRVARASPQHLQQVEGAHARSGQSVSRGRARPHTQRSLFDETGRSDGLPSPAE